MAAPTLPTSALDRLTKLAGMLGSDHDGERASAALLATRLLRDHGLTWRDVLGRQPSGERAAPLDADVRTLAAWCAKRAEWLTDWELDFALNVARRDRPASAKQGDTVRRLAERIARCTAAEAA